MSEKFARMVDHVENHSVDSEPNSFDHKSFDKANLFIVLPDQA